MAVASNLVVSVRPPAIRPCAAAPGGSGAGRVRSDGGGKWWAPLLGWSGRPDYIDAAPPPPAEAEREETPARRFGGLTEEKARELRMRMVETQSFHDAMYHSAIASRLASPAAAAGSGSKARRSG